MWTMSALVFMLAVVLAGPGSDAAPLPPMADHDAIYAEIVAGDPTLTDPPAPLERLVAATELAEEKLREAADADDADDLLTLVAKGRRVAYGRENEALHLCRLIAAADHVLARADVTPDLSKSATDFRQEAQGRLGEKSCAPLSGSLPPPEGKTTLAVTVAPSEPARPAFVPHPPKPADRRLRAGLGTLVPGLVLFAPMAGLLAFRLDARRDLADLNTATATRPATDTEVRQAAALHDRFNVSTAAAVALGATGGALVVTGAVLLTVKRRPTRAALAPWGGRGVGGLVLLGRF